MKDAISTRRYAAAFADPAGPIRSDLLPLHLLFDEPFYQLLRQQLLAAELEKLGVADVVRVVHVLPPENRDYQTSLVREEHRVLGETVDEVWSALLRHPDRFQHLDPVVFCDPLVTSEHYVSRYGCRMPA